MTLGGTRWAALRSQSGGLWAPRTVPGGRVVDRAPLPVEFNLLYLCVTENFKISKDRFVVFEQCSL